MTWEPPIETLADRMEFDGYSGYEPFTFYSHHGPGGWASNFFIGPHTITFTKKDVIPFEKVGEPGEFPDQRTASFHTVEHFFQACKATDFHHFDHIYRAPNAIIAKKRGGPYWKGGTVLREDWEDVKYDIMMTGLFGKFQAPLFKRLLFGTDGRPIYEDSPYDDIWGVRRKHGAGEPDTFDGENLLGKALMDIRSTLHLMDEGVYV